MARKSSRALKDAQQFYRLLLYQASGGTIGKAPEKKMPNDSITFGEKRALLDSIVKISEIERKSESDKEPVSGLDLIRKNLDASGKNGSRGDNGRSAEDTTYVPESDAESTDEGDASEDSADA